MPSPLPDDPDLCRNSGSMNYLIRGPWLVCPACTRVLKPFPRKTALRPHRVRGRKTKTLDRTRDVLVLPR